MADRGWAGPTRATRGPVRSRTKDLSWTGLVGPGVRHAAAWEWPNRDRETILASIWVEVRAGVARHLYSSSGGGSREVQDYTIALEATAIGSVGLRWWFRCMASRDGGPACRRRARVLYLPPGGRVFACRACYGPAYASSRESR